jgi:hypothetical protein
MDRSMIFRAQLSKILLMCGAGLSVQFLASGLELKRFESMLQINVAQAHDERHGSEWLGRANMALLAQGKLTCEEAKRQALEAAPELLALASWPLDDNEPAECVGVQQSSVAISDDVLPALERPEVLSVDAVLAVEPGSVTLGESIPLDPPSVNEPQYPLGQKLAEVDSGSLDEIRGGFELDGSGLKFSFGIERAVYINGELITSTSLNLRDLKQLAGAGSAPVTLPQGAAGSLGIIQNGSGNNVSTTINPNSVAGTIIQNTLNNQKIQNVTTINASVNSLQTMRTMSVQSAIQSGIVGSLRR